MREYSKVGPKFWIGKTGKALRAAGKDAQIVAMYLLSSPHANMLGLYYCPTTFIAHETGLGFEGASKGLQGAIEAGFCEYDEGSEVVWVIEMAGYQVAPSLKVGDLRVKGVQNEYASVPGNPYLARFYDKYKTAFHMENCRGFVGEEQAPSKPLASQEQEQEKEQKKEQELSLSGQGPDAALAKTGSEKTEPPADDSKKAGSKKKHGSAEDHEAARWIFAKLRINDPTAKEPNWDGWANEVRLMVERDARTHREICELFLWAQKHQFWCANILSPSKLREKWTQLIANQNRDMAGPRAVAVVAQSAEKTNAEARRLLGFAAKPGAEVIDG